MVIDPMVAVRAMHFASIIVVAGTASFSALVIGADRSQRGDGDAGGSTRRNLVALLVWPCLAMALVSAVAWLVLLAANISGESPSEALRDGTVLALITDTQFGRLCQSRLLLTVVLAGLLLVSARLGGSAEYALRLAIAASAAALLGSLAWAGHAGGATGGGASLHLFADVVHLLGAGVWVGGLFPLALMLWRSCRMPDRQSMSRNARLLKRFSNLGIVTVAALFASGVVNTWFLTAHMQGLVGTDYGQLLQIKIALFLVMLGLAGDNRLRLLPRLLDAEDLRRMRALRQLQRNTICEIALGLGVVYVVAALGLTPPVGHVH